MRVDVAEVGAVEVPGADQAHGRGRRDRDLVGPRRKEQPRARREAAAQLVAVAAVSS